jgi:hypothetical protein
MQTLENEPAKQAVEVIKPVLTCSASSRFPTLDQSTRSSDLTKKLMYRAPTVAPRVPFKFPCNEVGTSVYLSFSFN